MRSCNTYANAPSDEEEGISPQQSPDYEDFGGRVKGIPRGGRLSPRGNRLSPRGNTRSHFWEMNQEKDVADLPIELAGQATWQTWAASSFMKHFLCCGLIIGAFLGYNFPLLGWTLYGTPVPLVCLCIVFFLLGMELRVEDCWDSQATRRATTLGIISVLVVTPLLAVAVRMVPFRPTMLWTGLAIFCCMPTTMGTSVMLTRKADGSVPMACLLTVVTNIVGMVTVPFMISGLVVDAGPVSLALKLFPVLLLPLLLGQAVRNVPGVVEWGMENRGRLTVTRDSFLVALPWMMISAAAMKSPFVSEAGVGHLLLLAGAGACTHSAFVALGGVVGFYAGMRPPLFKAFVVCTSHKSMPTALAVALFLPQRIPDKALAAVPILLAHFAQTVIGNYLVQKWAAYDDDDDGDGRYRLVQRTPGVTTRLHPDLDLLECLSPIENLGPSQDSDMWSPPTNGLNDKEQHKGSDKDVATEVDHVPGAGMGPGAASGDGGGGAREEECPALTTSHFGQRGWSNHVLGALQMARNKVLPTVLEAKVPWSLSSEKSSEREERSAQEDSLSLELLVERSRSSEISPALNGKQGGLGEESVVEQ